MTSSSSITIETQPPPPPPPPPPPVRAVSSRRHSAPHPGLVSLRRRSDVAQRFHEVASNWCPFCAKALKALYCHACGEELCLACSSVVHSADARMGNHKRVVISKKAEYIERVMVEGTKEHNAFVASQMVELNTHAPTRLSPRWLLSLNEQTIGGAAYLQTKDTSEPLRIMMTHAPGDDEFAARFAAYVHTHYDGVYEVCGRGRTNERVEAMIVRAHVYILVLSPYVLNTLAAQCELQLALLHHKRIIPVVVADIDDLTMVQRELLDLSVWVFFNSLPFDEAMVVLTREITRYEAHTRMHTKVLLRTLLWDGYHRDRGWLLQRGGDARAGFEFMLGAAQGQQPSPTRHMLEMIALSVGRDTSIPRHNDDDDDDDDDDGNASVYVCFDRHADCGVVRQFVAKTSLKCSQSRVHVQYTATVDGDGGDEDEEEMMVMMEAIRQHDVFVIIVTPSSMASAACNAAIDTALAHCKRVIPVMTADVDIESIRHDLAVIPFAFFREGQDDLVSATVDLKRHLDRHSRHVRYHTTLLLRAHAWMAAKRATRLLMTSTRELLACQDWFFLCALGRTPRPSPLMVDYFATSQRHRH